MNQISGKISVLSQSEFTYTYLPSCPYLFIAGVAELVDAPDSKSGSGNRVRVRVSLPAPSETLSIARVQGPPRSGRRQSAPGLFFRMRNRFRRFHLIVRDTFIDNNKPEPLIKSSRRVVLRHAQAHGQPRPVAVPSSVSSSTPSIVTMGQKLSFTQIPQSDP